MSMILKFKYFSFNNIRMETIIDDKGEYKTPYCPINIIPSSSLYKKINSNDFSYVFFMNSKYGVIYLGYCYEHKIKQYTKDAEKNSKIVICKIGKGEIKVIDKVNTLMFKELCESIMSCGYAIFEKLI